MFVNLLVMLMKLLCCKPFSLMQGKNTADTVQKLYNMVLWLWFAEGLKGHWVDINEL